jgi:hypothetical protein
LLLFLTVVAMEYAATIDVEDPSMVSNDGLTTITVPGMFNTETGSGGMLPALIRFIPVPPGSEPVLEWSVGAVGSVHSDDSFKLSSAPVLSGRGMETVETCFPVEFPAEHPPVSFRVIHLLGTTVAKVTVSPFCYGTPDRYAEEISFTISAVETSGGRSTEGTLLSILCPDSEEWWPYRARSPESPFWGKPWARIKLENTGFYSITGEELEASGCSVTGVPSTSLSLFTGQGEIFDIEDPSDEHYLNSVSISVYDGGDGIFDLSDSLIFYGQGLWHWNFTSDSLYRSVHPFDDANTYWLTWGGESGERINGQSSSPEGGLPIEEGIVAFGFEQDILSNYEESRTGWIWNFLYENLASYFFLSTPFSSDIATVRLSLVNDGGSGRYHTVKAELEGTVILDSLARDIEGDLQMEFFTIENVQIQEGGNLLKMWCDYPYGSNFNYAEILMPVDLSVSAGYQIVVQDVTPGIYSLEFGSVSSGSTIYDISDPVHPIELTQWELAGSEALLSLNIQNEVSTFMAVNSGHYFSVQSIEPAQPGRLLGASSPADVIVTVPESMKPAVSILESLYAARGLSLFIVTYREVYDEFNQGVSDPGAIRSLVRWALDTWPDPPQALFLIGDGSNDPLGLSTGFSTIAPVYILPGQDRCVEAMFAVVHENSEDPEIPVYRIPASNANELLVACEKSVALGNSSIQGPWSNTVMLAADDEWGPADSFKEDEATDNCETLADSVIPSSVKVVKLYEIAYPWPPGTAPGGVHPTKPEAASDFIEQLNSGVLYTSFFGHGSYDQMTAEKLFSSSMVSLLNNAPRYFLYNSFSCDNGFFDLSAADCLAEMLLFHPEGGAAVTMACVRKSLATQNLNLSTEFTGRLHSGELVTIAEALWLSQLAIGNQANYDYCVLGDGGITLPRVLTAGYGAVPADTLSRGLVNTVNVNFPGETSFLLRCLESADTVHYVSPLSESFSIDYLRYGSELFSGIFPTDEMGTASVSFFVPLQADTGFLARTDATGSIGGELGSGYSWPIPLIDRGEYSDDSEGPQIEISFPDTRGGEIPSVYQNAVMHAVLSDPSGICVLGDDAGSIIIGSVDGGYEDITELFSYDHGSYTSGTLDYIMPELLPGIHNIRVVARDGMENTGEAVQSFIVLQGEAPMLENTGVYPNPVRGQRAFFFTTSGSGMVEVTVYTVAGRPVWRDTAAVQQGPGQLVWNGMDSDGDAIAAGVYIFLIQFESSSGSASANSILVVSP